VDATGVGAGLASFLQSTLKDRVIPVTFSPKVKSELGWNFLAIVEIGRYQDYPQGVGADDGKPDTRQFWYEVEACQYQVRDAPNKLMSWGVWETPAYDGLIAYGHDDLLMSAALSASIPMGLRHPRRPTLARHWQKHSRLRQHPGAKRSGAQRRPPHRHRRLPLGLISLACQSGIRCTSNLPQLTILRISCRFASRQPENLGTSANYVLARIPILLAPASHTDIADIQSTRPIYSIRLADCRFATRALQAQCCRVMQMHQAETVTSCSASNDSPIGRGLRKGGEA
jgi:hypothetical protein